MSLVTWKDSTPWQNSDTVYGYIDGRSCIAVFWHRSEEGDWKVDTRAMNTNKILARTHYRTKMDAMTAAEAFALRWVRRLMASSTPVTKT